MDQIRYSSNLGNEFLATFDGVVLEMFGPTGEMGSSPESRLFHRDLMSISMEVSAITQPSPHPITEIPQGKTTALA